MKHSLSFYLFLCSILLVNCSNSSQKKLEIDIDVQKDLIQNVMHQQEKDWNNGDIDGFMQGYWKSDQLTFIGSKGIVKGWNTTLENYKQSYPNKEKMGKLTFDIIEIEILSSTSAFMIGKYSLQRATDKPEGYFNLLWKKIEGKWLICSDHTSG